MTDKIKTKPMMKKYTVLIVSLLVCLLGGLFLAAGFVHAASVSFHFMADRTITGFFQSILSHLQGVVAFLSVLFLVLSGILYITSSGNSNRITTAKLCLVGAILGFTLALAGPSLLKQIKIVVYGNVDAPIPTDLGSAPTIADIVERALSFLLSILGMLAIIGLTVSGIMYLFAMGGTAQAENAKQAMKYSVIGIAVAGASLILVQQIVRFFN